ncbi:Transcription factor TFIIB [Apiospora kogelbergensis]|uniref:Transcription factor TFIIB n=1 Tax=Apiospora kogelbergensis TaxID=1337665 RepID=UPI003130CF3E
MSSFFKPNKTNSKKGTAIKPRGSQYSDRLRENIGKLGSQSSFTPAPLTPVPEASVSNNVVAPSQRTCPNKHCPEPSAPVQDGYCSACGREIDTSNIVSEVQFGETSTGAAMVQGSFIGADQGASRPMGPGMRRIGGNLTDNREKVVREAKTMMTQYAHQLRIGESIMNEGLQVFKLCVTMNWIQGRGMIKVVPVCLYAACRKQERCRVMLIDFAELVKVNVYELGHVFKDLNNIYDFSHNNINSVVPEDLIYRFCDRLDFGDLTKGVAETATKLCQRMGLDWMVMGRRPSGICGACIAMASQIWGFRRTVREIVYIVKVTMHTIEQRLGEFRILDSSDMTIEDFLKQELLSSRHDPPSFYKSQDDWKEKMEKERIESGRKRKRIVDFDEDEFPNMSTDTPTSLVDPALTQRTTPAPQASPTPSQLMPPPPPPDFSRVKIPVSEYLPKSIDPKTGAIMIDAFDPSKIPAPAPKVAVAAAPGKEVEEGLDADDPTGDEAVDHLAETYDDGQQQEEEGIPGEEEEEPPAKRKKGRGKYDRNPEPLLNFDDEWEHDEDLMEQQIAEVIADPHSDEHRRALANAALVARIKAAWARGQQQEQQLSMGEHIDPNEFADDPEVENCLLTSDEIAIKEKIWMNANKDWLRKQQEKQYRKAMEELGPQKKKRNRQKKPRIGEGQLTPASTPGEAAMAAMKKHTLSSRINLDAINNLFSQRKGSRGPGSVADSSRESREDSSVPESETGDMPTTDNTQPATNAPQEEEEEEEEEDEQPYEDEEDYTRYDDDEEEYY